MEKKDFITSVFKELEENNIDYFVVGEYEYLPNDTGGSDIDIIILGDRLNDSYLLLNKIARENDVILASQFRNDTGLFLRYLDMNWGVQIDLFNGGFFYNWNKLRLIMQSFYVLDVSDSNRT